MRLAQPARRVNVSRIAGFGGTAQSAMTAFARQAGSSRCGRRLASTLKRGSLASSAPTAVGYGLAVSTGMATAVCRSGASVSVSTASCTGASLDRCRRAQSLITCAGIGLARILLTLTR